MPNRIDVCFISKFKKDLLAEVFCFRGGREPSQVAVQLFVALLEEVHYLLHVIWG